MSTPRPASACGPRGVNALPRFNLGAVDRLGIRHLVTDSRRVQPGDTFLAYPGDSRDGRDFIGQALENGAAAVLWDSRRFAWNPE